MALKLSMFNPLLNITRGISRRPYIWYNEGIQYPGFKYYPRTPDFKDPPYQPTKLFRVQRIKRLKGLIHWEKHILKEFGLDGKKSDVAIIKNIPENNARLWKIKHIVEILPVTFPNGFPSDSGGTYLKENGELVVSKRLNPSEVRLQASEAFRNDSKRLDGDTLRRDSRERWNLAWD